MTDMKKIGLEEHFHNNIFYEYDKEAYADNTFPNLSDPERFEKVLRPVLEAPLQAHRIPVMDKNDIRMHIISPNTCAIQYLTDAAKAVEWARVSNDAAAALVAQAPDRLRAYAILPMQDPVAAAVELRFRVEKQGFVGAFVFGSTLFSYYDDLKYDIVWQTLEALDVPMYLHVANPEADQIRMYEGCYGLLGNTWNWGCVAATHALRLVFNGVFERHPGAKLILGHMGEMLPYVLGRLDEGFECRRGENGQMANPPSFYIKRNVYIATSGAFRPETLRCAIDAMGIDKIMFATDYPHFPTEKAVAQIENSGISAVEKEAIYYRNAERVFHL